jgi:hypothetical protein
MQNAPSTTAENLRLSPDVLFASANTSIHFALHCL